MKSYKHLKPLAVSILRLEVERSKTGSQSKDQKQKKKGKNNRFFPAIKTIKLTY